MPLLLITYLAPLTTILNPMPNFSGYLYGMTGTFKTTLLVPADQTFDLRAFLPREMVSYRWQVTPTTVPDRYEFVLQTTFETYVPIPVVTVDPGSIDLCTMPGDTSQINLTSRG